MTFCGHEKRSLLIVDDDECHRAVVAEAFERAGFVTRQASTGEAAIHAAREERPTAVLLDVILPGATGYEICRELKDEHGADLPVVFVTGERKEPAAPAAPAAPNASTGVTAKVTGALEGEIVKVESIQIQ